MKRILIVWMVAASALLAEFDWAASYEAGLAEAKQEGKKVMLMFSTQTCKMCNYMKKTVYEDERVGEYIDAFFIPVEVDIERHPNKYGYKVIGTPTYYFLTPEGEPIGRMMVGGADADGFLEQLQSVNRP
ncbi:MAG: thioredoxin family protein [Campylobacterales bacterium]|nr:thioredoxin family protein [Campylobacterales bacterium]